MLSRAEVLERLRCTPDPVQADRSYVVEAFRPADALGLALLFRTIYGESYPIDLYYDPDQICSAQESGRVQSVVARLDTGHIAGHMAIYRASAPFSGLHEIGLGMVHPRYQGGFILFHLFNTLMNGPVGGPGVAAVFGEAVCDKISTQHLSFLYGLRETALEMDLLAGTGQGRVSCLFLTREAEKKHCDTYIPNIYREQITFMLAGTDFERSLHLSTGRPGKGTRTRAQMEVYAAAGIMRAVVLEGGEDFIPFVQRSETAARDQGCLVFQWFIDLGRPDGGLLVDALRHQGYFLGGLVPRWFDGDGLLMQKISQEPGWDRVSLFSDKARDILSLVKEDFGKCS